MPRNIFERHVISIEKLRAANHVNLCRLAWALNIRTLDIAADHEKIALAVFDAISGPAERFDSQDKRNEYASFWENANEGGIE